MQEFLKQNFYIVRKNIKMCNEVQKSMLLMEVHNFK